MPIDFEELRRKNKEKREADRLKIGLPVSRTPTPFGEKILKKELAGKYVANEFHKGLTELEAIDELLESGEKVNEWERNFLQSIRKWVLSANYYGLSVKQKAIFEKICRNNNLHIEASKIPTQDNRYASNEYIPPNENRNSAPVGIDKLFDSYEDDDIPF